MEREIKFRVWHSERKTLTPNITIPLIAKEHSFILADRVENYDFMQYIGLKDKNGIEIYEGDIIHKNQFQTWSVEYDTNNAKFIAFNQVNSDRDIGYDVNAMCAVVQVVPYNSFECEVIGNIYENPELLK